MKKIGMIMFGYPLGVSISIINSAILLEKEGYEVHIFIDSLHFHASKMDFDNPNIVVHIVEKVGLAKYRSGMWCTPIPVFHGGKFKKAPIGNVYWFIYSHYVKPIMRPVTRFLYDREKHRSYPVQKKLHHYAKHFFADLFEFCRKVMDYIDDDYICIIGIEPEGLIAAFLVNKKIPIIYFNMELLLEKECKTPGKIILKSLERDCNQRSYITLIQDSRRAKYLMDDNNISEEQIIHVPTSALGEVYTSKSNYLHRILGINKDKKIILYAGHIVPWSMSLEIAQNAQKWSDDKVLVLHNWRADEENTPYVNRIRDLTNNEKVYLSFNPVEWQSLPELLSSADIGLVFYQNLGQNFYETGTSSNKLPQYLQVGLPVITIDYPSFREVVEQYKCGKCTGNPEEIEKFANEIFSNYDVYRKNAFKCYQEKYEFSRYFKVVIDRIKDM